METFIDQAEDSVGISVYLGDTSNGFSAISKARYSDFVVHEISLDGRLACLDSMEPPSISPSVDPAKASSESKMIEEHNLTVSNPNENKRKTPDDEPVDWESVSSELANLVDGDSTQKVVEFLQAKEKESSVAESTTDQPKFILLPQLPEKEKRRQLHQWVRERLPQIALSDTSEGQQIRIWHASHRSSMPHKLDNRRKNTTTRPPKPPKSYLQFVLYKENMDTGSAIQLLSRRLGSHRGGRKGGGRGGRHHNQQQIRTGYAGNKDKRGVTTQFVTVRSNNCTPQQLCQNLNRTGSGGGHTTSEGSSFIRVGNFEYVDEELRLGRLQGNRFDIVLRNIQCNDPHQIPRKAVGTIRETGFINYFGTQRFGKNFDTHLIGMAVVRGDFEGAVNLILSPKEGDESSNIFLEWEKRFQNEPKDRAGAEKCQAQELLKSLSRFMHSESAVLRSLIRNPLDYKRAFESITKTMRMMFVHALQSFLWNKVASFRIETLGRDVVKGDLVVNPSLKDATIPAGSGLPDVQLVTDEDLGNKTYSMEDVVLPLIGAKTRDPGNDCSALFNEVLKEYNLSREMLIQLEDRDFNAAGDYRKLLCRPSDVDFKVIQYGEERKPLLETDIMKLQGIKVVDDPNGSLYALRVGFSLPSSSYATMFLRELMKRPTSSAYQSTLKLSGRQDVKSKDNAVVAES